MYGIRRKSSVLCHANNDYTFVFCTGDRIRNPVMISGEIDVDIFCQECTVMFNLYDLSVFEFTKEEEAEFLIRKLKGL